MDWKRYVDTRVERSDPNEVGKSDFDLDVDRSLEQLRLSDVGDVLEFRLLDGSVMSAVAYGRNPNGAVRFFIANTQGEMSRAYGVFSALAYLTEFISRMASGIYQIKRY